MKTFIGLADNNGIEQMYLVAETEAIDSFIDSYPLMKTRAYLNRHRNAVVFQVVVSDEIYKRVQSLLKTKNYKEALLLLKESAKNIIVETNCQKLWDNIPKMTKP